MVPPPAGGRAKLQTCCSGNQAFGLLRLSGSTDGPVPPFVHEGTDLMGLMRFVVTPPERLTEAAVQQAYLSGLDRVAWQVRATGADGELQLRRSVSDSGNLHFPWPVPGHGLVTLCTGSLRERPEPYQLPLELARGTLAQLRDQLSEWQTIGLAIPDRIHQKATEAVRHFSRAAVSQEQPAESAAEAEAAIRAALAAGDLLSATYTDQAISFRRRGGQKLAALMAANLGSATFDAGAGQQYLSAFNGACVPFCWRDTEASEGTYRWELWDRQIKWSAANNLRVCGGPLLLLDSCGLPDWLALWEDDFENILSFVSDFITATIERYRGKVALWQCAARLNTGEILNLSEEDKLRMAARTVELTRRLDPQTPAVISFDQPWAEYMSRREVDFPPLHFADALVRAGLDLSGIMLEINVGYHPGGTLLRSLLEFGQQLDFWSMLGLPLIVSISVPSAAGPDPRARRKVRLASRAWSPQVQHAWVARYLPMILAKPYVQGVVWNQLFDSQLHDFPHGGLFDQQGQAKPALRTLAQIRRTLLK